MDVDNLPTYLSHIWANYPTHPIPFHTIPNIDPMFRQTILLILFHSILFQTIQLSNPTNHSIPFYFFFNLFFQLSKSLYNIFKSLIIYITSKFAKSNYSTHFSNHFLNYFQTILTISKNGKEWAKWFA